MTSSGLYLYPNPAFSAREPDLVQVLPPYGFVSGGGSLIQSMLYARLARMSSKVLPPADSAKGYLFFSFLAPYKPPHITWTPEDRAEISAMGPERVDYMPNDMRLTSIPYNGYFGLSASTGSSTMGTTSRTRTSACC